MASKRTRSPLTCQSCYETEKFDDMVMCGSCQQWEHFCCAGVGPKIKNRDFQCSVCKAAEMAAVRKELKNLNCNHEEIKKSVLQLKEVETEKKTEMMKTAAAAASVAESVVKKVEILKKELKFEKTEVMATVAASATHVQSISEEVKALNSDRNHLKAEVSELKDQIHKIKVNIKEEKIDKIRVRESTSPTYQLTMLPSNSLAELKNLLDYVQSVAGYEEFKAYISALCGTDLKKSIRAILNRVMSAEVQRELSWSGFRTNKPSFETKFKRIVDAIGETLQEKFQDYNYDILKKKISTLLSNA